MAKRLAIVLAFVCCAVRGSILREKPSYLESCSRYSDPEEPALSFEECMRNAFQHIFTTWKDGVPGAEEITEPMDPLFIRHLDISGDVRPGRTASQLIIQAQNLSTTGLSRAIVDNVTMQESSYNFRMVFSVPKANLRGRYSAKGQINILNLDSRGDVYMEIIKGVFSVLVEVQLSDPNKEDMGEENEDGFRFFIIKNLKFSVHELDNVHVNFKNLFADERLTKNTNALLNARWRLLFHSFKPRIERSIGGVFLEHFRRLFAAVPANYFITDL